MNKLLLASLALVAVGMTAPAKAADMPVKYVAPAPVFTWTGVYVGLNIGTKYMEHDGSTAEFANAASAAFAAGCFAAGACPTNNPSGHALGVLGGRSRRWVGRN